MKNILTKLANLWNWFTRESEEWEYFKYLRRHPDRTPFIEGKTKAKLAQELHDWKMRSSEQALTISQLTKEIEVYKAHRILFSPELTEETSTEYRVKVTMISKNLQTGN